LQRPAFDNIAVNPDDDIVDLKQLCFLRRASRQNLCDYDHLSANRLSLLCIGVTPCPHLFNTRLVD
jgi:hypothetical protein